MSKISRIIALVVTLVPLIAHADQKKIPLSLVQLDTVSAGYLEIKTDALAQAAGKNTSTETITDAKVKVGKQRKSGYTYSKGKGYAYASASGEIVYTDVSAGFSTDEEIVFVKYMNKQKKKHSNKKRKTTEVKKVRIKVVTRQLTGS